MRIPHLNTENPDEYVDVVSSGRGGYQDKGVGKAMTYAYKYMILRTFAIPTGEDPDKISSAELDKKQEGEAKEIENSKITETDISAMRRYLKNHGISEEKVLKLIKLRQRKRLRSSSSKPFFSENIS